jgi:hypothetical protein
MEAVCTKCDLTLRLPEAAVPSGSRLFCPKCRAVMELRDEAVLATDLEIRAVGGPQAEPAPDYREPVELLDDVEEVAAPVPTPAKESLFSEDLIPDIEAPPEELKPPAPIRPPSLPSDAPAASGYIKATDSIHVDSAMFEAKPAAPMPPETAPAPEPAPARPAVKSIPRKKYTVAAAAAEPPEEPRKSGKGRHVIPVVVALVLLVSGATLWFLLRGMPGAGAPAPGQAAAAKTATASDRYSQGNKYFENQQFYLSLDEYKAAVRLDANFALAYRGLAAAYGKLGKMDEAVRNYEQYLKLLPTAPDAAAVRKIISDYYGGAAR